MYFFIFIFNPFVNGKSVFGWIRIWLQNKERKVKGANKIAFLSESGWPGF